MDINKEKLKNRLNVKFEPFKAHPTSLKRLQLPEKIIKDIPLDRQKESSIYKTDRNRSTTHVRLPSLQKKTITNKLIEQKTEGVVSIRQIKNRIKSIKALPVVKVQSKESINQTITYLIKNQVLNVPKIVAMLQKSQSDEFMYMKVKGIYEYEVCSQAEKGNNYITVSKNGMVSDGELVPLQSLIKDYEVFTKLRRIQFFRYFSIVKCMNKWNRGSKLAKFIEYKFKIKKLLYLENERIIIEKLELKNILHITSKGGNIQSGWVNRVANEIERNKETVQKKLLQFSLKLLQKFELPLGPNFELMNKVLLNTVNLNLSFQKKLRIEKQLQVIYKLGRMLEMHQQQSIAFFLIEHIQTLINKFIEKNEIYRANILEAMEALDITQPNYLTEKEKILLNNTTKQEINFKMLINPQEEIIIEPTMKSILSNLKSSLKDFISQVDKFDFRIIRVPNFYYVVKNVVKPHDLDDVLSKKEASLREYIYSINLYFEKLEELKYSTELIEETIDRKIKLVKPFFQIYCTYRERLSQNLFASYNYDQIYAEWVQVEEKLQFCQSKLHDGEYFILGYLSQLQIKEQIIDFLNLYKKEMIAIVPNKIKVNRQCFYDNVFKHLSILRTVIKSPEDFITVYSECDELDQKIIIYASDLNEIQRMQKLYLEVKKVQLGSLADEKNLLNELKIKCKNYKETKENSFIIYRKEVENKRKEMLAQVDSLKPNEEYYQVTEYPGNVYSQCHRIYCQLNQINKELVHLNQLQAFFNLKLTYINRLDLLTIKFEHLSEFWLIHKEYQQDFQALSKVILTKQHPNAYIKKYEGAVRKVEKFSKDPDFYKISEHLLSKIPPLLNTLYLVEDLQNPILRPQDFTQIGTLFEKQLRLGYQVSEISIGKAIEKKLYQLRPQILQINFKSHKEQQIQKLLSEFQKWWKTVKLEGQYLEEYPLIIIFNDNDHIRQQIEEQTTILMNIINHKYGSFARKDCNKHLRNINSLAQLLGAAIEHQDKFLNLFPILTSRYAQKQLPSESKRFMNIIEKNMKNLKWLIKPTENLNQNTRNLLTKNIKEFDTLSKVLATFLQKKRVKFQRFYFLQDDELLEVLVGIGAENTIFRMFQGVRSWLLDEENIKIGVIGVGNQNLKLKGWSYKSQQPQIVFKSLEQAIRVNLNSIVRHVLHGYQNELKQLSTLYQKVPWMCVYTVELVLFTKQVEINCFQNEVKLAMQTTLIQQNIAASVANPLQNSNYITLQLFLLHFVEELRHQNVTSVFDFKWNSFLRYYYEKENVVMRALGSQHAWGGQYQGLWNLMINTSDIRRAHTSILSNLKYGNGVLLQGPSGTGKTESLKELGRCMAKYCVIFNCSSQVNIRTLQKLLSGLCYTGSWLCLDEINRLSAEIMSVVATQINSIKNAIMQSKQSFDFMGRQMKLRAGVGIFSTMNPIYLKRAKLTESLKSYFRVISVNVPDYQKILEVMLYSSGIAASGKYSELISKMFKNLSIQLSQRPQYDFGMRAMKFFIYNLNHVRKSVKNEQQSIIEALEKTFYSRLDPSDKASFSKVLSDTLGKKREEKSSNYSVTMMKQAPQTGIIVLGPTSSKSTTIKQYISLFNPKKVVVEVFNPNSVDLKHFLGENLHGKWEQGIVQKMARASFEDHQKSYILILDCKLRSETIENFNTLLDDSKLLSLSNGTRLKIQNNFKIIMETPDLEMTSPATITRCNLVYLCEESVKKTELISQQLPQLSIKEIHDKIVQILAPLSQSTILKVIKMAKLIFYRPLARNQNLSESESFGFEKSFMFACQLLGYSQKIKQFLNRDNSVSAKKSFFNFYINFSKYKEGEFFEFQTSSEVRYNIQSIYIPSPRDAFYIKMNSIALEREENILWKGGRMTGKSTALLASFDQIFKQNQEAKNIFKISMNGKLNPRTFVEFLEERSIFREQQSSQQKALLVYLDDINLANEEIKELLRFSLEYNKLFSLKERRVLPMQKHLFIADATNQPLKEFTSRFCRHFTQINLPPCEEPLLKSIFTTLVKITVSKTNCSEQFKNSYDLQVDRIVDFMLLYMKINNDAFGSAHFEGSLAKQKLTQINYGEFFKLIRNLSHLNDKMCQQTSDFIVFVFSELRSQEVDHRESPKQLDFLKVAYSQVFKQKYQREYTATLKSMTGHPSQTIKFTKFQRNEIRKIQNWQELKTVMAAKIQEDYYVSQFILLEIIKVLRVIYWNGGNYYLVGNEGIGKKTILKISCFLSGKETSQASLSEDKKIEEWYFNMIKLSFEQRKQQVVIMQVAEKTTQKMLEYLQQIHSSYPVQNLLNSQNCDYAYNNAEYYDEITYKKFNKPYIQVINDFLTLASRNIQYMFHSVPSQATEFARNYHYLHKNTCYSFAQQFPSEAILQISSGILQKHRPDADNQKINTILLKIYNELTQLMKNNIEKNLYHFKYNPFCHFSMIKNFLKNYNLLIEEAKLKEDILNRSILKVHQISQTLQYIKQEIRDIEPVIQQKTQKLLAVVPILEEKKRASQQVKSMVLTEKKEIEAKNDDIQEMVKEVEAKIKRSEPLIQQANESMLTIKRGDLSQLRNNPNPHPLIKFTLENMVILLGETELWQNIKKVLSDPNLLSRLKSVGPSMSCIQKVQKRIQQNSQWTFQNVSKVSYGVRYMVKWIANIIKFFQMKFALENEKNKVQSYKGELQKLEQQLNEKQGQLNIKEYEIKVIEDEYIRNKNQLLSLQELVTSNNRKFENAQLIKEHLHHQINNWYDRLNQYKNLKKNAEANSIFVTLYLQVYLSLHSEEQETIDSAIKETLQRLSLPFDNSFKVEEYVKTVMANSNLTNRRSTQDQQGITHKKVNIESLSLQDLSNPKVVQTIYHLNHRPIILDPDNQALNWLRRQCSTEDVIIVKESVKEGSKQSATASMAAVEQAMKEGHILVLLMEEQLDNFSKNVLNAKITETADTRVGEYNKNIINIERSFRMLLCNKSRNPNVSGKLYINHPVINFEITKKILKQRLIKELIMLENKDIYSIQKELEIETKNNEKTILGFEKQIIESLISSKRNLIDDNEFISLLQQDHFRRAYLKSTELECHQKSIAIKHIVDNYQNLAEETSKIFVSLKHMTKINPILSWNTDIFVQYFAKAVQQSITLTLFDQDDDQDAELENPALAGYDFNSYNIGLGNSRPTSALSYMSGVTNSRGNPILLDDRKDDFEELQQSANSPPKNSKKQQSSFQNLIGWRECEVDQSQKGVMSRQREKKIRSLLLEYLKPAFSEQERIIWGVILCLIDEEYKDIKVLFQNKTKRSKLKDYLAAGELTDRIKNYLQTTDQPDQQLLQIFHSNNPFHKLADQLSPIEILLLGKLIAPSNFSQLCQTLIREQGYGDLLRYTEVTTGSWFQRSDNVHPILLIMGEDPLYKISEYLSRKRYRNVILIPMGEGQNKLAEVVFEKEIRKQNLVIIHNLHISSNFMLYLSKMLQQFQIRPPDKKFRLILISTQFEGLNEEITSYCHKYIIEQPMGIKNQIRYLRQQNPISLVHPEHRKLAFVLAYMHSIINNLSKFKPYGWNLKYEFHTTDFINAIQTLKQIAENYLNVDKYECNIDLQEQRARLEVENIDFKALKYMVGQIGYIGKLADDIDRAKMNLLVQYFISPHILQPHLDSEFIRSIRFSEVDASNTNRIIEDIPEQDSTIFGLHPLIKPVSEGEEAILSKLSQAYHEKYSKQGDHNKFYDKRIEPISHKFEYINQEIRRYNQQVEQVKAGEASQVVKQVGNGLLLSSYSQHTKVFNLRAFSNPKEFFISIITDVAHKNEVVYEKVELIWSLLPRQNTHAIYAISNLKLEGASLNCHRTALDEGVQQTDVTLYVQAVVKKKEKEPRRLVSIPIYLNKERQGQINSYGENTNLLARAKLQANHAQQFWILRSTAFVVQ